MSTTPNQVNGPIGTVLQDTATLTGSSGATGSIEFKLYATADCSGPPADDETVTVTGDGSYAATTGYTAAAAGAYQWTASYSGDAGNNPAVSGCGAEQVEISSSPVLVPGRTATSARSWRLPPHDGSSDLCSPAAGRGPVGVVVNGGTVYWIDSGAGTIMAVLGGFYVATLVGGNQFPLLRRVLPGGERIAGNGQSILRGSRAWTVVPVGTSPGVDVQGG